MNSNTPASTNLPVAPRDAGMGPVGWVLSVVAVIGLLALAGLLVIPRIQAPAPVTTLSAAQVKAEIAKGVADAQAKLAATPAATPSATGLPQGDTDPNAAPKTVSGTQLTDGWTTAMVGNVPLTAEFTGDPVIGGPKVHDVFDDLAFKASKGTRFFVITPPASAPASAIEAEANTVFAQKVGGVVILDATNLPEATQKEVIKSMAKKIYFRATTATATSANVVFAPAV